MFNFNNSKQICSKIEQGAKNFPPDVVARLVKAQTTAEGYRIISASMLNENEMEIYMNL